IVKYRILWPSFANKNAICWQNSLTGPSWLLIKSTELPDGIPPPNFSSRPPIPVRIRRPWFDLLRLINILRLEDGSPQTFRNLRLGLNFDPVLSNDEGMKEVRVSSSSHFRNLDFSRRSEEHTSELQSRGHLVCRLLLE